MGLRARILPLEFRKLKEKIERHERAWEPAFYRWEFRKLKEKIECHEWALEPAFYHWNLVN